MKKSKKKQKKKCCNYLIIGLCLLDLGALFCLVLAYGPNPRFKNFLITTAMSTMNHKYLAHTLYSDKTIKEVMEQNTIVEVNEATDTSAITIGKYETENYDSIYEEQILKKDPNNDVYKIFSFKENKNTYYITVIYDPSRIHLALTSKPGINGQTIKTIAKNNNALVAINASGFEDAHGRGTGARATGTVIKSGKVVWRGVPNRWGGGLIGFNKEFKLVLTKKSAEAAIKDGMIDAVTFGPFLIVNGKSTAIKGTGGGVHPRTVIAQRQDGIVLFVTIDGNGKKSGYRGGASYKEICDILNRYKVYNAANLDGGASSILVANNNIINHPIGYSKLGERQHPNAWIVK